MPTPPRSRPNPPALVPCWKCLGVGRFDQFSHIQNGICFACNGTKQTTIRTWTEGLRVDKAFGWVSFEQGGGSGWVLILDGKRADTRYPGVLDKPRPHKLSWIRRNLDLMKAGQSEELVFTTSILLASLTDCERAWKRAVGFLVVEGEAETDVSTKLAAAMPAARAVVAVARDLAKQAGFAPPLPYRLPRLPYAVACLEGEGAGLVGGSDADGLTWEDAEELKGRFEEEHGGLYAILKFDHKLLAWVSQDQKHRFE